MGVTGVQGVVMIVPDHVLGYWARVLGQEHWPSKEGHQTAISRSSACTVQESSGPSAENSRLSAGNARPSAESSKSSSSLTSGMFHTVLEV